MTVAAVPTLYEYYTSNGIQSGLSTQNPYNFTLNNKNITLYSGAFHYFRVPPPYWRSGLQKMRAAGLNTVETYVPWNLHEPQINQYDFGQGNSDLSHFLHIEEFLKIAQEEDLFAIVRPGPYICAEFEFGGLPSWILRDGNIKIRTSQEKFMSHVTRYFSILLGILSLLQFTSGGPIIAFQIENEYGSTETKNFRPDKNYLKRLEQIFFDNGIKELLFTSDSPSQHGNVGTLPHLFQTANFASEPEKEFDALRKYQNKPTMAMEFWSGWFDHWGENHHLRNNTDFRDVLERILKYPASVNFYMFHGGTSWGFLNGANVAHTDYYQPDTTSYDYDAPISESGDYTEKYHIIKQLIEKYNEIDTKTPLLPEIREKIAYPNLQIEEQLDFSQLIQKTQNISSKTVLPMEMLPINNDSGQSYGYIVYRKQIEIPPKSTLKIPGLIHDFAMVLFNGELISPHLKNQKSLDEFGFWRLKNGSLHINEGFGNLDIVVGNMGRNNFGSLDKFNQFKGLSNGVYLNNDLLSDWEIFPLEFKRNWIDSLSNWVKFTNNSNLGLYKTVLTLTEAPKDTFIDMSDWKMGIVIVNSFVLGRYMHIGPQQTLYLPAPFLKIGINEILIFEHFTPATFVRFSEKPIYFTKK